MKRIIILWILFLASFVISAQQKVVQLYQGAAPGSESWNWNEADNDNNIWGTKVSAMNVQSQA
jgi:hypothetical protein